MILRILGRSTACMQLRGSEAVNMEITRPSVRNSLDTAASSYF